MDYLKLSAEATQRTQIHLYKGVLGNVRKITQANLPFMDGEENLIILVNQNHPH